MGLGSRAWFSLMRRNLLYRRRYWLSSILELVLPMLFILLLVWIRSLVPDALQGDTVRATFPDETDAYRPLSFRDYTIAMKAERICIDTEADFIETDDDEFGSLSPYEQLQRGIEEFCTLCFETDISGSEECSNQQLATFSNAYCSSSEQEKENLLQQLADSFGISTEKKNGFVISGIPKNEEFNQWMVPFIKCDSDACTEHLEDAEPFCERKILGLVGRNGGRERVDAFVQYLQLEFNISDDFYRIFDDEDDTMDQYVRLRDYGIAVPKIALGIEFDGVEFNNWKYSIRPNSTNFNIPDQAAEPVSPTTPTTSKLTNAFAKSDDVCSSSGGQPSQGNMDFSCTGQYMYNGVLTMQRVVQDFILNQTAANTAGYQVAEGGVSFVPFPTPEYEKDSFFAQIQDFVPIVIILGMLYPVASMISYLVKEKDFRQKELMKMMSVTEADLGWSWFVTFLIFQTFTATFATWMSTKFYRNASASWLWIFWMAAVISFICYCMVIAALTSKPTRAVLLGVLVFLCGVFLTLAVDYEDGETSTVQLISLHPVSAFAYGLKQIGRLEEAGVGLTSNTLTFSENASGYSFLNSIWILIFDSILWGGLAWYLNRVIPPAYGQAMPIWFPFTSRYWFPNRKSTSTETDTTTVEEKVTSANIPYEPVSDALKRQATEGASIEIHNLVKQFGNDKTAVDGLNLSMYSGQITALLGHNGAGKTTTINMLTGAMGPTSGYATVAGRDIRTELSAIRQDIGICLQHDCLFPDLTVREHVEFFARLKGLYANNTKAEAERQVDQAIRDVALFEKRNSLSKTLSGGMKRKLSVAIAFCGGSKVVLLDEPTSGMDPFSRRFTWNVIRQYRQERCIILTTHFMDEADILGDRIAIMASGQLRCAGGPLFLKKTYGVGYQLTIEKVGMDSKKKMASAPTAEGKVMAVDDNDEENLKQAGSKEHETLSVDDDIVVPVADAHPVDDYDNNDPLTSTSPNDVDLVGILEETIPEAVLLSDVGTELKFQLPLTASSKFAGMFNVLDKEAERNSIVTYGVSMTTLDEVFLLVARGDHTNDKEHLASSRRLGNGDATTNNSDNNASSRSKINLEKNNLFGKHLAALFKKRAANFRRDKRSWVCTTLVPSAFVLTGLLVGKFVGPPVNQDPLALDLSSFNPGLNQNPIAVNAPDSGTFKCQPGQCLDRNNDILVAQTGENYIFCAEQSFLTNPNDNQPLQCSVSESAEIMNTLNGFGGADVFEAEINDIAAGSLSLAASAGNFAASQYGAIWFARDTESIATLSNTSSINFNTLLSGQCRVKAPTDYSTVDDCDRFLGVGYVVQYNFTGLHTAPLLQALADQALVRYGTNNPDFKISATIAPLPITRLETGFSSAADTTFTWFLMMLSFPFIGGAFATFVVNERQSKAKHLQTVAGVEPVAYWISTFLWDTMNYQIPLWITVALMFIFDVKVLTTSERDVFSGIIALMFCFGPAFAGFCYCLSFLFKSASLCQVAIIISGFIVAFVGSLAAFILVLLGGFSPDLKYLLDKATIVIWCCRLFPTFCLGKGLLFVINIEIFSTIEQNPNLSAWSNLILKEDVIVLIVQAVVYLILAIVLDIGSGNPACMNVFNTIFRCQFLSRDRGGGITTALPEDEDVLKEQQRVENGDANDDLIVISNLTKLYGNGKLAVNNMSLGIAPGECFGLLGINGAGKTTCMGMLTAEFPPSSGDATLAGISIVQEPQKIRRRIGYCPQFDAHFANMTGREHVELYAAIKGIPSKLVPEAAAAKLKQVGLEDKDADRLCAKYSGGMKRRLSLACATIGQPQLVFLDECSTGVDPVARREIWQMVSDMVSSDNGNIPDNERTSVVLTTHSMEECEALCPRIGIMANGRLRCLGSAQHLKTKFGQGFQLELKVLIPTANDTDYVHNASVLARSKVGGDGNIAENGAATGLTFQMMEVTNALRMITNDDFLAGMVHPQSPNGYTVWKDANSITGVTLETLATFATGEIRLRQVGSFVGTHFPKNLLRERQDLKVRYEVSSDEGRTKISDIFSKIEASKESLHLADYGVSQTSLEQVFNMHAAEAEKLKQGRDDQ